MRGKEAPLDPLRRRRPSPRSGLSRQPGRGTVLVAGRGRALLGGHPAPARSSARARVRARRFVGLRRALRRDPPGGGRADGRAEGRALPFRSLDGGDHGVRPSRPRSRQPLQRDPVRPAGADLAGHHAGQHRRRRSAAADQPIVRRLLVRGAGRADDQDHGRCRHHQHPVLESGRGAVLLRRHAEGSDLVLRLRSRRPRAYGPEGVRRGRRGRSRRLGHGRGRLPVDRPLGRGQGGALPARRTHRPGDRPAGGPAVELRLRRARPEDPLHHLRPLGASGPRRAGRRLVRGPGRGGGPAHDALRGVRLPPYRARATLP